MPWIFLWTQMGRKTDTHHFWWRWLCKDYQRRIHWRRSASSCSSGQPFSMGHVPQVIKSRHESWAHSQINDQRMQPALAASSFTWTTPVYIRLQIKGTYIKSEGRSQPLSCAPQKGHPYFTALTNACQILEAVFENLFLYGKEQESFFRIAHTNIPRFSIFVLTTGLAYDIL